MYQFYLSRELIWAALTGAGVATAQILVDFQPETIADWRMWAVAGVGAIVRAVGVSVLASLGKARVVKSDPLVEAAGGNK